MYCFRYTEDLDEDLIIKVESWFTPKKEEERDYKRYVSNLQKKIKQMTYDVMDTIGCDENYIVSLDMRPSGIKYGKPSYMCCDIVLTPKDDKIDQEMYLSMLDLLFKKDEVFRFYQQKGEAV